MRTAEDFGTMGSGQPDLQKIFARPGGTWSESEVLACLQWLLTKKRLRYLLSFILRHLGPRSGQEDAREVWSSFSAHTLLRVIKTYDPDRGRSFWSYFLLCLKRYCFRQRELLSEISAHEQIVDDLSGGEGGTASEVAGRGEEDNTARIIELRELLQKAFDKIKPLHAEAMIDHYLRGKPISQIAAEKGVAEGTVKAWLFRGRHEMRAELKSLGYQ